MKKYLLALFFFGMISLSAFAQLQNTGWRRPSATHLPDDWTNPQNAFGSDDFYAEVLHQSGCRCPFMDLSWDDGNSFTSSTIFGPYGTTDSYRTQGDSLNDWGHQWIDSELSDSAFVLRIWNSSTLLKQGYANFGFGIPPGSSISGIEVRVEAHGDSNYTYDMVDVIEAMVYYTLPTAINEAYASDRLISVFPNPTRQQMHIRSANDVQLEKIQVVNLEGMVMAENNFTTSPSTDYTMDVSRLPAGMYVVNIICAVRTVNTRIVIF